MNWTFALNLYLVVAVFWAFVPGTMMHGPLALIILQVLCIGGVVVGTWRVLAKRGVKLDNRIGLGFLAYIAATTVTNIIGWFLLWRTQ
jgi:hypothetical protein